MLVKSGETSLAHQKDYPLNIIRGPLGLKPDSVHEKLLLAFLDVIEEHERSVTLAYLLAHKESTSGSLVNLFEVFQTVGIKFGQMSAIWNIFGEEASRELASLKSHAKPMTKLEVETALEKLLTPAERSRIKQLHGVIGSASLKTVVEAELITGERVALLIQRPNAQKQITGNLALAKRFLQKIRERRIPLPTGLFDLLTEDIEHQLAEELKMSKEATRIEEAGAQYERVNREVLEKDENVHFEVPSLVEGFERRDELLVVKLASGIPWKMDFGQAFHFSKEGFWKEDERYLFASFLHAFSKNDPS